MSYPPRGVRSYAGATLQVSPARTSHASWGSPSSSSAASAPWPGQRCATSLRIYSAGELADDRRRRHPEHAARPAHLGAPPAAFAGRSGVAGLHAVGGDREIVPDADRFRRRIHRRHGGRLRRRRAAAGSAVGHPRRSVEPQRDSGAVQRRVGGLSTNVATYVVAAMILGIYFAMNSGTVDSIVYDTVLEETGSSAVYEKWIGRVRMVESAAFAAGALAGGVLAGWTSPRLTYFVSV